VKEVRLHSERGKATQWPGWLEQLLPCPAAVWGSHRMSCRDYGHRALEAWLRDGGSGEAELAPKAKGSGEPEPAPEAKGTNETEPALEPC